MFYLMEILKLDSALEVLYLNKDKAALGIRAIQKKLPIRLTGEDISMMLEKFLSDKLVSEKPQKEGKGYFITYEGIKFYQRGGYLRDKARAISMKFLKALLTLLGIASTIVGIALGMRELL